MQYKKKFVNDKILQAGRDEYMLNGYRGGNISTIAEKAGVPVGNLYRYFDGKPGLLDAIVKNAYKEIPEKIEEYKQSSNADDNQEIAVKKLTNFLTDIYKEYGVDLVILLDKCEKSRYDDVADKVLFALADYVHDKYFNDETKIGKMFSDIITNNFLSGVYDIVRLGLSVEETAQLFARLSRVFFLQINETK